MTTSPSAGLGNPNEEPFPPGIGDGNPLAKLDFATRMLAEVRSASDAMQAMALASAVEHYAKKVKMGQEAIDHAHSIKLQAETTLGRFLKAAPKNEGGRPAKTGNEPGPVSGPPVLADLGLTKNLSSEAQFLAVVAESHPDEHRRILENEKTITQVRRELKKEEMLSRVGDVPTGKFRVIYADPPWHYSHTLGGSLSDKYGAAEKHYPTMTMEELCALPIAAMAEDDAVLFLWTTSPLIFESQEVFKAWGFTYKAMFVWDKQRHNLGHYNSVRHELLLICTRGSCLPEVPDLIDSVQSIQRSKTHSEKPEEFRKIIDTLYPRGRRVELFARRSAEGWERAYSDEVAAALPATADYRTPATSAREERRP